MNEIKICGLQKTTLLDYPGHVASTIFLGGCNFRCPFCHNAELLGNDAPAQYTVSEVLTFLKKRSRILEGVCITGGEPTLHPDGLEAFIRDIRALGLLIKLDTNGSRPDVVQRLAANGLLNYIAVDIKAGWDNYGAVCGVPDINLTAVQEMVAWLKRDTIPYELRTTVVKGLHTAEDFEQIAPWISGCPHYYLQNYVESERILQPDGFGSFSKEELLEFAAIVRPFVGSVELRGVDY